MSRPDGATAPAILITSHFVHVPGFYKLETEATNGEIEQYLENHQDDEDRLKHWENKYARFKEKFQVDDVKARPYPALFIAYRMAKKYAASVGGLLPTEAEWEFAARSHGEEGR